MNKVIKSIEWVYHHFFFIAIAILIMFYLRWFQLTPLVFSYYDDPTVGFIVGFILLLVYSIIGLGFWRAKKSFNIQLIFFLVGLGVLGINGLYLDMHMPRLTSTASCNGITYNITYIHPFLDEQLTSYHLSIWKGVFNHESFFYGYGSVRANKVICDEVNSEANFVDTYNGKLYYTDGDNPRTYVEGASAKIKKRLYFLSNNLFRPATCNEEGYGACDIFTYTLYQCKLDYTACIPLPITYSRAGFEYLDLRVDKKSNEIRLYEQENYKEKENETLIYTYGENPRCYVEGCSVTIK